MTLHLDTERPSPVEVTALYDSVGWSSYTSDPGTLAAALAHSPYVLTARQGGELVGLLRAVGDGHTILYIQDLLVDPLEQRRGIGSELVNRCLADHQTVRQVVVMTDNVPELIAFYRAVGFHELGGESGLTGFVQIRG